MPGVIEHPDDVFFLGLDEIRETGQALPAIDRRALIAERKAEIEWAAALTPPPASDVPTELRGSAGSPGKVRGTARIIDSLDQANRLHPGEVLVAELTAPPWTPLFATASAVVTDAGGILSHCAVVAREYGIPAVVGTARATSTIRDGQQIEVDVDAGLVRLLD